MRYVSQLFRGKTILSGIVIRRNVLKIAKWFYWRIPVKYRNSILLFSYRVLPRLFSGIQHFEQWRSGTGSERLFEGDANHLQSLSDVSPAEFSDGNIAIHLHLYYEDLAKEFYAYLKNMPFNYDLFVSVANNAGERACKDKFSNLPNLEKLIIEIVPNQGRDMAPMFCTFGKSLRNYKFIAHLHSKKSIYNQGATDGWRQYLCESLFGNADRIRRIFSLMQSEPSCGIVYPQTYHKMPHWANTWLANRAMGIQWCFRLGIPNVPRGYFDYPVGSMFWARTSAMRLLFDANITLEDFEKECGQKDGTFAHCLERLLALASQSQGFKPRIIKDEQFPSWSKWRIDQCLSNSLDYYRERFRSPTVKVIGFDIFDTLLVRPMIEPEAIKKIVARRVSGTVGDLYLQFRTPAENIARKEAGHDVGIDAIYIQLQTLSGMSSKEIEQLKTEEKNVEYKSVSPRNGVIEIYREALNLGKPVILISDMFLPKNQIAETLNVNGISGWAELFVSGEIGLRKDCGELYDLVFSNYRILPHEFLMVGDNERSDIQIPADKGAEFIPVLRPTELARATPILEALVERTERYGTLDDSLTFGLVLQKQFSAITYQNFEPRVPFGTSPFNIGYSVLGPILLSFSNWLLERSRVYNIERLYFLAREGEILKTVYDIWSASVENAAKSNYLVVSRRSISVAALSCIDDILKIASTTYFPNTLGNFLLERYGLSLSKERWNKVYYQTGWSKDKIVEVKNHNVEPIRRLLEFISEDIVSSTYAERSAMQRYLSECEFFNEGSKAVVDVGYGATIQDYLNYLDQNPVHGFYLITDERSSLVSSRHQVMTEGCFYEKISCLPNGPLMYRHSFELEKLMSSNSAQIIKYVNEDGHIRGVYRELSNEELKGQPARSEIQAGVICFVEDALRIRNLILPEFNPSTLLSKNLYECFVNQSSSEIFSLFKRISLDDHYCGRGVVN